MIHVDHNHPSTSPLKSSASAAVLDSFTWDVGIVDDTFGAATAGASGIGPDDSLDSADEQLVHTQEFRPEEFLNDDLEDVIHLPPDDVGDVGDGFGGLDPLGVGPSASSSLQPPRSTVPSNPTMTTMNTSNREHTNTPNPPPPLSTNESAFLNSPNIGEGDRSSSLSPVPETNSPSGQGEGGSAGDGAEEKEAEASVEQLRKEEEEEEEVIGAAKVGASRQSTPLSPLTPPADELDGEGEGEGEEKKEGEKKAEENTFVVKDARSLPQQKQLNAPQYQQQKQLLGRQTTKSPTGTTIGSIPLSATSTFMHQQQHQLLRPSPDTTISTPDLIAPPLPNTNTRDPKVVRVLDLNVELLK
jgi:hypothetical protein